MSRAAFLDPADLPDAAALLLADAGATEFQLSAPWFAALAAAALPQGAKAVFLQAGAALLPLYRHGRRLHGLTTPYTSVFRPLISPHATAAELTAAGRDFARACRHAGPLRLDALDAGWAGLDPLLAGFRAGGMVPLRFHHFANWHLPVAGQNWAAYLAARPGELRTTLRRKLARSAGGFEIVAGGAALAAGIAAYETVYAHSWKQPEPAPRFAGAMMQAASGAGALRLGLLHHAGRPVAAQIWTVAGGIATVHKLAHDQAAQALSPGSVLTALMIRHLLDKEHVAALDFGRGDDGYKAAWTGQVRPRIGVLLCPLQHPAGLAALARHGGGRLIAPLMRSIGVTAGKNRLPR